MGTIDTLLRVKADASQAVRGLSPLQASLQTTAADAVKTEAALNDLSGQHTVSLNDQAIESARVEVERLRNVMREQLRMDPTADTREAQRNITQLQRSIRTLDRTDAVVDVAVHADATELVAMKVALTELVGGFAEGGGGGLIGRLTASRAGVKLLGSGAAGAAVGVGSLAVAGSAAAAAAWDLGEAAADVQTQVAQLNALTGGLGTDTFTELNQWATTTPFALDDATAATKRLVAAGVDLQQIPQYLNDIGNVAAATGVPLEQIATVFSQMESKGKLTFEETQQLAEAGIPVWATLADKLGLTVAEVQKLATEGKLGASAVDLLRVSLAEQFPNAMAEQAATFNGQMSTLKDTVATTRTEVGTLFLPMMQDVVAVLQAGADATHDSIEGYVLLDHWLRESTSSGSGLVEILGSSLPGVNGLVNALAGAHEKAADAAADQKQRSDDLAASLELQASASAQAEQAISDQADKMDTLATNVTNTSDAYRDLRDNFSSFNQATIDARSNVFDYQDAIDTLAESLVDSGTFSPDAEKGRTNWDNLVGFAEAASARVEDTWKTKGKGAAVALQASFRQTLHGMLTDAGINSDQAWKLVDQVLKVPHKINVELGEIDDAKLRKRLASLRQERADIKAKFVVPEGSTEKDAQRVLDEEAAALRPINVKIDATLDDLKPQRDKLDETANPDGDPRKAHIDAKVSKSSVDAANADLDGIIKLRRTAHVDVVYDLPPPLRFFGLSVTPSAGPTSTPSLRAAGAAMMSAPAPSAAWTPTLNPATPTGPGGGRVERLAPKSTPVAVYLDGVEIAHRIEARRAVAATSSTRRSA
jgi:tape measure domain-containing protein